MTTDGAKQLRLQSWFSPAFPIGAFSYSHGLEWAVEEGTVTDRGSLVAWLEADLCHGSGRADAIFFVEAWRATQAAPPSPGMLAHSALSRQGRGLEFVAPQSFSRQPELPVAPFAATGACPLPLRERAAAEPPGEGAHTGNASNLRPSSEPLLRQPMETSAHELLTVAELAAARRATSELALESGQQGIAFLGAVRKAWPHPELDRLANLLTHAAIPPVLPVAAGICCAVHEIGLELALPVYVQGSAGNLVNAALRLIPLGQTDGQIAVAALEASVLETAREAMAAHLDDIGSAAFMIDLASMRHETQYTRLFRS